MANAGRESVSTLHGWELESRLSAERTLEAGGSAGRKFVEQAAAGRRRLYRGGLEIGVIAVDSPRGSSAMGVPQPQGAEACGRAR